MLGWETFKRPLSNKDSSTLLSSLHWLTDNSINDVNSSAYRRLTINYRTIWMEGMTASVLRHATSRLLPNQLHWSF